MPCATFSSGVSVGLSAFSLPLPLPLSLALALELDCDELDCEQLDCDGVDLGLYLLALPAPLPDRDESTEEGEELTDLGLPLLCLSS